MNKTKNGKATAAKVVKVVEVSAAPGETKANVDKEVKIQGQVDANAAAILRAHDEGKSVKELHKMFGIGKGLFCDLVYIVLFKAGRLPKSKYAERVAAKHPVTLDRRFVHLRPEQKKD